MSKQTFIHLIYIPFTSVGLYGGYRGNVWYKDRIEIFKNYTLKSLLNQSEPNFVLWISFRPQEQNNPLTAELANYLKEKGVEYLLTFNGLMYWDDKYTKNILSKIKNCARVVRGGWRNHTLKDIIPGVIEIFFKDKNSSLTSRVKLSVAVIEKHFKNVDWVYVTRIDSDDMFHKDFVHEIQQQPVFEGAYTLRNGFIYNKDTEELAFYRPATNPPFHTIMFQAQKFFNAEEYVKLFKNFRSHEDIPKVFPSIRLRDNRYCVLTHNPKHHISTVWNHPFRGELLVNPKEIIKDFGI